MTEQPRTRQDLYDRIRQSSKEEFILDEMIRLGFWTANGEIPNDPADEIRRRGEIQRELDTLRRFRATLYQIEKDGLAGKQWGQGADLLQSIAGFANYVAMVDPTKGREFLASVGRIQKKYGKRKR